MFTISGPVFGLNGNQVASIVLRVFVPGKTKLTADNMREFALQLFNVEAGATRRE